MSGEGTTGGRRRPPPAPGGEAKAGATAGTIPVQAGPPDPDEFAAFGAFLTPPTRFGDRTHFGDRLEPVPGRTLETYLNRVAPTELPATVDRVERHPHAAQLFLPVGVSRYLVTVMPSDEAGEPDPSRARAFVVPGHIGVAYRPGIWHAGISVLDAEGSFAILMWRGGEDDDVFASIPPIEVRFSPGGPEGGTHG